MNQPELLAARGGCRPPGVRRRGRVDLPGVEQDPVLRVAFLRARVAAKRVESEAVDLVQSEPAVVGDQDSAGLLDPVCGGPVGDAQPVPVARGRAERSRGRAGLTAGKRRQERDKQSPLKDDTPQ